MNVYLGKYWKFKSIEMNVYLGNSTSTQLLVSRCIRNIMAINDIHNIMAINDTKSHSIILSVNKLCNITSTSRMQWRSKSYKSDREIIWQLHAIQLMIWVAHFRSIIAKKMHRCVELMEVTERHDDGFLPSSAFLWIASVSERNSRQKKMHFLFDARRRQINLGILL